MTHRLTEAGQKREINSTWRV